MQIQVCRKCGNRNTVISGALTACNYCGSTDLEPITETGEAAGEPASGGSSKKGVYAAIALLVLVGGAGAAYWQFQQGGMDFAKPAQTMASLPVNKASQSSVEKSSAPIDSKDNLAVENGAQTSPEAVADKVDDNNLDLKTATLAASDDSSTDKMDGASSKADTEELAATQKASEVEDEPDKTTSLPDEKTLALAAEAVKPVTEIDKKSDADIAIKQYVVEKKADTEDKVTKKVAEKTVAKPKVEKAVEKVKEVVKTAKEETKKKVATVAKSPQPLEKTSETKAETVIASKPAIIKEDLSIRRTKRMLNLTQGVVTDNQTGLMWMACSLGQEWDGNTCSGEATEYLWTEANSAGNGFIYANYQNWRLPTRQELQTIVQCPSGRLPFSLDADGKMTVVDGKQQNGKCLKPFKSPTIDQTRFPNSMPGFYWSYSRSVFNNYSAWGVFFNKGYQYSYNTGNLGYVRLVRNVR